MTAFLEQWFSPTLAILLSALAAAGVLLGFVGIAALMYIWLERKVSGRIQDRLGPTRTGPYGLLQSLADGIKLITKEDLAPTGADLMLFRVAPYLAFCAAFAGLIALPFGDGVAVQPLATGAFFLLAVLASEVFGVILAGYSSGSKWSMFGGLREAAQVVSYEVPRTICVLVPICMTGTLNLITIGQQQVGGIWNWNWFHDPFSFCAGILFFVVATASCKRAPFDLAEAESELVAGFLTEYSGLRWSLFFLAEYTSMFAVSGLAVMLFLGGWHTGALPFDPAERFGPWVGVPINATVVIAKSSLLILVMMWLRWSLPRLRIDQVMTTCLKYFLPMACFLLLGECAWQLLVPPRVAVWVSGLISMGVFVVVLLMVRSVLKLPAGMSAHGLPGAWAVPRETPAATLQPSELKV